MPNTVNGQCGVCGILTNQLYPPEGTSVASPWMRIKEPSQRRWPGSATDDSRSPSAVSQLQLSFFYQPSSSKHHSSLFPDPESIERINMTVCKSKSPHTSHHNHHQANKGNETPQTTRKVPHSIFTMIATATDGVERAQANGLGKKKPVCIKAKPSQPPDRPPES